MRTELVTDVLRAAASVRGLGGLDGDFADVGRELGGVTRSRGAVGTCLLTG